MKAAGNGNVAQCVANLLLMYQGDVPYQNLKGMDPQHIDENIATAQPKMINHATWLINTYEERATINEINATTDESGTVQIVPDISY